MIDAVLSLALSMYANPGVYALLLGSGVSRAAAIPTGWEVVEDLTRRLAALRKEDAGPDPAKWYQQTYGREPGYADILEELAPSQAERSIMLRRYFEPTEEEREQGIKTPTAAHRAIAQLVHDGYVRLILTTNFDRLIESALEDIGIRPMVISTPDAVEGMTPLPHAPITVIKLHGDYLDARIRNTREELASYDPRFDALLDRVLDEYGMVVCGWSAEWDEALRCAMERCPNRRYTTYWCLRGEPTDAAQRLITQRRAEQLAISDADRFFPDLQGKVRSLQDIDGPHPLSAPVAAATVKRFLAEDRYRIRLDDLVMGEVLRLSNRVFGDDYPLMGVQSDNTPAVLRQRAEAYEAETQALVYMLASGCFWGTPGHTAAWTRALTALGENAQAPNGDLTLIRLRLYPVLMALYSGAMGALAREDYKTLVALLRDPLAHDPIRGDRAPLSAQLAPHSVIEKAIANAAFYPTQGKRVPVSERLHGVLRPAFRQIAPADREYDTIFDRFEYLRALAQAALDGRTNGALTGRFVYQRATIGQVLAEVRGAGEQWPLVAEGLFQNVEHVQSVAKEWSTRIDQIPW